MTSVVEQRVIGSMHERTKSDLSPSNRSDRSDGDVRLSALTASEVSASEIEAEALTVRVKPSTPTHEKQSIERGVNVSELFAKDDDDDLL